MLGRKTMSGRTPKEVFLMLLSEVRNRIERQSNIYQEIGKHAEEPEIREAIEARVSVSKQNLAKLDECFRIIGEKPEKSTGQLQETFLEDFRKEVAETFLARVLLSHPDIAANTIRPVGPGACSAPGRESGRTCRTLHLHSSRVFQVACSFVWRSIA